jgi:hydroxymethylglutaryl-CoA lyase
VMNLPATVRVVEVGARDGLQNEPTPVPTEAKIRFIEMLAEAGLPVIEATSFVSPRWVPQLADAETVMQSLSRREGVRYPVLVPNLKGLERALQVGVDAIAIFTAASETFCQRNLNRTIEQSLQEFEQVVAQAKAARLWVRGYISTAFVCPYEGRIAPEAVKPIVERLLEMGVDEISLGDTIGAAVPTQIEQLTDALEPQHLWHGAGECADRAPAGDHDFRLLGGRAGWMPLRARGVGQPRNGRPALHAARDGD